MVELTRQCLALSYDNRVRLIKALQRSLHDNEIAAKRFEELLKIARDIVGYGIMGESRDLKPVIGRRLIAYQMRQEGYSSPLIGSLLRKNHTSVLHMTRTRSMQVSSELSLASLSMCLWRMETMQQPSLPTWIPCRAAACSKTGILINA